MLEKNYPSIIRDLKRLLPPTSWQWVLPALRLDPLIWESLCNYEQVFGVSDLSAIIHEAEDCSPAALALKALRYPRSPQELRLLPLIPVEADFREAVDAAEGIPLHTLKDAALLALNLRQKRQLTGSWNDWVSALENTAPTALACLFGLIPDQIEYLQALLPSRIEEDEEGNAFRRVSNVILSNPAPFAVQSELVTILLRSLSPLEQELFLQTLLTIQPAFAKHLPTVKTQDHSFQEKETQIVAKGLIHKITNFAQRVPKAFRVFDGRDTDQKAQQLTLSIQFTAQTQALMLAKLAILSSLKSAESEALNQWQNAMRLQPHSETLSALYLLTAIASGDQAKPLIDPETVSANPEPQTALLRFVHRFILDEAEDSCGVCRDKPALLLLAQQALEEVEATAASDPYLSDGDVFHYFLALLCHLLIQKGWVALASQTLSLLLRDKADQPSLLALMALLLHAQGLHEQALNLFHLLEGLLPQDQRIASLLAQSHEANGEWRSALQIWSNQTRNATNLTVFYEMITCARFSSEESLAIETITSALKEVGKDGILFSLLAEIDRNQAPAQRLELLEQASIHSPSEPYVWLAYARTVRQVEGDQQALSILRAAEQTLPKDAFIQSALGALYLESGQPSLALPHLQSAVELLEASKLLPSSISIFPLLVNEETLPHFFAQVNLRFNPDWGSPALTFDQVFSSLIAKLGETLLQLGHRQEARKILEKTLQDYPAHAELRHQLARLYLAEGNFSTAGQLLKELVAVKSPPAQVVVDFARCALHEEHLATLDEIILSLQQVLEHNPDDFGALTLLAEALGRTAQPQAALQLYDQILRFPQAREQPLKEELSIQMSKAALKAGEYELALTTLLECDQHKLSTQRMLAETYYHLGLFQESVQSASAALSLNETELENLAWYATFLTQVAQADSSHALEYYPRVIQTLQKAVEIDPEAVDLQLALAEAYYQVGDHSTARQILLRFAPNRGSEMASRASTAELSKAAHYLNLLGETFAAISCYEGSVARLLEGSPSDVEQACEILLTIAEIYRQNHRSRELKEVLERAVNLRPDDLPLFFDYLAAWLEVYLTHSNLPFDPQECVDLLNRLEAHLDRNAQDAQLRLLFGLLLRWMGESDQAIEVFTSLIADTRTAEEESTHELRSAILLTAIPELSRIYRSRGEDQLASFWLNEGRKIVEGNLTPLNKECLELVCDWLEESIARKEDCSALLFEFCNRNPDHLRLLALMSAFKINQEDFQGAKLLFDTAITALSEPINSPSPFPAPITKLLAISQRLETLFTISTIAQRLGQWNLAFELLNQALRFEPQGKRVHWARLKCLVLRGEYQLVCQRLGVIRQAPGPSALGEEAANEFRRSAEYLQLNPSLPTTEFPTNDLSALEWLVRGQLLFATPGEELFSKIHGQSSAPLLGAALLSAPYAVIQEILSTAITAASYSDPLVRFHLALSIFETQADQAIALVENLLMQSDQITSNALPRDHWSLSTKHFYALVGAIYAKAILTQASSDQASVAPKCSAALETLEQSLQVYPEEANWHVLAARLASLESSSAEHLHKAIAHLEQALQLENHSIDLHVELAQLYLASQQTDLAIQTLENAKQIKEEDPRFDYWLAKAYLQRNQVELAAQYAQSALEKNPLELDLMLLRGEIALQMHDVSTALQSAEQALEYPTEDPRVWSLFARALHAAGKTEDALRVLEQTIPLGAEFLPLHLERIEILRQWRGAEAALQAINLLLESHPRAIPLLLSQAEILAELDQNEAAISVTQNALRQVHQAPHTTSLAEHAHCHRLLGELFYRSGHLDQAVYHLSEAIQLMPNCDATYLTLGDVYLSRGENERALAAYQQCLQQNRENSQAYFKSGVLYKESKDYDRAEQMLRQAARLEPNNLAIQRQLGAVVALNLIHSQRTKEKKLP